MSALVGPGLDRVDGPAKVTGSARYSAEFMLPQLVYGVIVPSTIANGRIAAIDVSEAQAQAGVVAIMTHENAPRADGNKISPVDKNILVLQDDRVYYDRQPIAVALADSFERATYAASLVRVRYARKAARTQIAGGEPLRPEQILGEPPDALRGSPDAALASAAVRVDHTYVVPVENHSPMEPHATVAQWDGDRLTVYDATQGIFPTRNKLAHAFGIKPAQVRVISYFVGGGFGCKGAAWSHTILAAMAARMIGRPVKIVLSRPQMFGPVGFRPYTVQRVALGAERDGRLVATIHDVTAQTSEFDEYAAGTAFLTKMMYTSPNLRVTHRLVRVNAGTPTFMRAPGETPGSFALESALDELAYALALDPLELRLRNYTETDPENGRPFTSKSLRECYRVGAEAFGWSGRKPSPRSMQRDGMLHGWGMATATYPTHRSAAGARVHLRADGTALVQSGTQEIGNGTYTAFTQLAAETLGLPPAHVQFELGDTDLPTTPISGGSQTTASVGSAVQAACEDALAKLAALGGGGRPSGSALGEILQRHGLSEIEGSAEAKPNPKDEERYSAHAFGAQFAEVQVDRDFGIVRVTRFVGAFACGRIVNEKLARSQYIGGITGGIGMALMEQTESDERNGRVMNANLADYLVPVNADVPAMDVHIVPEIDERVNPIGVKGIGEIGIVGVAAAIANAVYHATGVRVRELPITPDKLLAASSPA